MSADNFVHNNRPGSFKFEMKRENMEDELSSWIQETVFSSYLEECLIFNELDGSYGFDPYLSQTFPSGDSARKRKLCPGSCEDDAVSAGKQARST